MPSEKLYNFVKNRFDNLLPYRRKQKKEILLNYIVENRDDLATLAENINNSEYTQNSLTQATKIFTNAIKYNFVKDKEAEFVEASKQAIYQIAGQKELPLLSGVDIDLKREGEWFFHSYPVNNRDKDKITQIKLCLEWMDCLSQFYFGESLYDPSSKVEIDKSLLLSSGKTSIDHENSPKNLDNFILSLVKQGYLQCDIEK